MRADVLEVAFLRVDVYVGADMCVEVVRAVFVGNDDMMMQCLSACAWTHVLKCCCCVVVADSMQCSCVYGRGRCVEVVMLSLPFGSDALVVLRYGRVSEYE